MKGFALVVLCFVAVQARYTGLHNEGSISVAASLGDNPWVVHLRVAVSTSGFLNSCAGSLIDESWVLTSASCVQDARFIWVRYGVVDVANPELVTETSAVRTHPDWNPQTGANDIALVSINRVVQSSSNIQQIEISANQVDTAKFCAWGAVGNNAPGESLACSDVEVQPVGDLLEIDEEATQFDLGAPLVADGVQVGLLVDPRGEFLRPALYQSWINEVIGREDAQRIETVHVVGA